MDRRAVALPYSAMWRTLLGVFVVGGIVFPLAASRRGHMLPMALPAAGLLWNVLVLPPLIVLTVAWEIVRKIAARFNRPRPVVATTAALPAAAPVGSDSPATSRPGMTRRQVLTAAALAAPPLLTAGLTGVSLEQVGRFRVRSIDLPVTGLPEALRGVTVAVVADVHTGPFTTPGMLEEIVSRVNSIHDNGPADLVVLAGDLINSSLRDLPPALEMATGIRGRLGTWAIMGNHDVMDSAKRFIAGVSKAGIPLIRDEVATIEARPGVRLQLLGIDWRLGDPALYDAVARVAADRDPGLFPLCLAHHPHAWDEAVRRGLPLVLSGHTHGGQIMLTDHIGGGPLKFRYWTGVYRRRGSALVVSNGVGNWFPLRVNAPAELLKLTLRPA